MRKWSVCLMLASLGLAPATSQAGIEPVIAIALQLIEAIPQASPPVSGANAWVGLSGSPALGSVGQGFSGWAGANASVDIDRGRQASATADAEWVYRFLVNEPGIGTIAVHYDYGTSTSVYTNYNANSRATASVGALTATITKAAFVQSFSWPGITSSGDCSSSGFFDDCGPTPDADAGGLTYLFRYSPGYPVGSVIELRGSLLADAFDHTGIGSAESSAYARVNFSVNAIPLPATPALVLLGLALIPAARRIRRKPGSTAQTQPQRLA